MNYYNSMQELVGNTPLVKLGSFLLPAGINLYAKLEFYNPSGSVKDRTARFMVEAAERDGLLKKGGTIVEGTAGNTGLGIAFAALQKGYRVIFAVPEKFSQEKQTLMRALGAEIVNTPRELGMRGASQKAEEIRASIPGAIALKQFENPANPEAHYKTTGPEIYDALDGKVDYLIAGAGSGGTYAGIVKFLKEKRPATKGILADPVGSLIGGGEHADYNIEGIGNDFIPKTMDMSLVDQVVKVTDQDAVDGCRKLAQKEGIIAGFSSGAAFSAALKFINKEGKKGSYVIVLPDRGDRYFSKGLFE